MPSTYCRSAVGLLGDATARVQYVRVVHRAVQKDIADQLYPFSPDYILTLDGGGGIGERAMDDGR